MSCSWTRARPRCKRRWLKFPWKVWAFTMGKPWENHNKNGKTMGKPWENHGKYWEILGKIAKYQCEKMVILEMIFQQETWG